MAFDITLIHDCHIPLYEQVESYIKDIEHWREEDQTGQKRNHVAVVVTTDGACFVGEARCSDQDQYDHRVGYELAVKRALVRLVKFVLSENEWSDNVPHFMVDPKLVGRDLYKTVRSLEADPPGEYELDPMHFTLGG